MSQRLPPLRPHPRPPRPGSRCKFGPGRRTAASILLFGGCRCGLLGSDNGPAGRNESARALLGRLLFGDRFPGPFNFGPSCLGSSRHLGPNRSRPATATLLWGFFGGRGRNFTNASRNGIDLAFQRLDLFSDGEDVTELAGR